MMWLYVFIYIAVLAISYTILGLNNCEVTVKKEEASKLQRLCISAFWPLAALALLFIVIAVGFVLVPRIIAGLFGVEIKIKNLWIGSAS